MADLDPLGLNGHTVDGTQISFTHGVTKNPDGTYTLKPTGFTTWSAYSQGADGTITLETNTTAVNFDGQLNLFPPGIPLNGPTPFSFGIDIVAWNQDAILIRTSNAGAGYMVISDVPMTNGVPLSTSFGTTGTPPLGLMELPCFVAGTRIATPDGEVAVELLRVGDSVMTIAGVARRVAWVGGCTVDCHRHRDPKSVTPIRIAAGTFADGMPRRDLLLSPEHCVYAEGVLVPVKALVNGSTIAPVKLATVSYHHVELDSHDVVLAEGLPAETFLDDGSRRFLASGPNLHRHPYAELGGMDAMLMREALGYAPLAVHGPEVERTRTRLRERIDVVRALSVRLHAA